MSLGRGILMGKVTRCKHSWSRSWWETVASQGQLWSQLYRFELEEKLRSKTLEQECHRRVNISHKFHGCFVWSLFECSCFHGARLSHLLLQPCNVSRFYHVWGVTSRNSCALVMSVSSTSLPIISFTVCPDMPREIEQRNVQRVTWGGSCGVVTSVPHYLWRSWRVPCAPYVCYIVYYFNEM